MPRRTMPGKPKRKKNPDGEMSLTGHLRELRNRLLVCLVLLVAAALAGLHFAPEIVETLLNIGEQYHYRFVYIAPQELLMQYVSVALIFALVVTTPMLCYQLWAFVRPGLKKGENLLFLLVLIFGLICFCLGVFFAFKIMMPFMLNFLISFGETSDATASISVENYMSFLMTVFLVFGAIFELPVLSMTLTGMGILQVRWMRKGRRIMVVVIFLISALITPPDVVSQIMVAIPLLALYEISILLCTVFQKLKDRRAKRQEQLD